MNMAERTFVPAMYHPLLRTLFLVALLGLAYLGVAQDTTQYVVDPPKETKHEPLKDRLWYGGGLGLTFGTVTVISIDPIVGYFVERSHKLSVGLGPSYTYYSDKRYIPTYEQSIYGYRVFTRYRVIQPIFLHAEFVHLNTQPYFTKESSAARIWVPHLLVGGGFVQPLGERTSFYIQALFEVLQDPNSVYFGQGAIFSGGVGLGF